LPIIARVVKGERRHVVGGSEVATERVDADKPLSPCDARLQLGKREAIAEVIFIVDQLSGKGSLLSPPSHNFNRLAL
jgi:hypothetical protein